LALLADQRVRWNAIIVEEDLISVYCTAAHLSNCILNPSDSTRTRHVLLERTLLDLKTWHRSVKRYIEHAETFAWLLHIRHCCCACQ
jgi:hypothetical protein